MPFAPWKSGANTLAPSKSLIVQTHRWRGSTRHERQTLRSAARSSKRLPGRWAVGPRATREARATLDWPLNTPFLAQRAPERSGPTSGWGSLRCKAGVIVPIHRR